jgi:hypothetical protein
LETYGKLNGVFVERGEVESTPHLDHFFDVGLTIETKQDAFGMTGDVNLRGTRSHRKIDELIRLLSHV